MTPTSFMSRRYGEDEEAGDHSSFRFERRWWMESSHRSRDTQEGNFVHPRPKRETMSVTGLAIVPKLFEPRNDRLLGTPLKTKPGYVALSDLKRGRRHAHN